MTVRARHRRPALAARRGLPTDGVEWVDDAEEVLRLRRGPVEIIANLGPEPARVPAGEVLVTSAGLVDGAVPTDACVWVRTS